MNESTKLIHRLWRPFLQGICVGAILAAVGLEPLSGRWWVGLVAFAFNNALHA